MISNRMLFWIDCACTGAGVGLTIALLVRGWTVAAMTTGLVVAMGVFVGQQAWKAVR